VKPILIATSTRPAHRPPDVHINVVTLARDPYHSSVVAKTPPPATGHSPNRAFFAWRSATRLGLLALSCGAFYRRRTEPSRCLAGRRRSSLLLFAVRRRSWGSTTPFAGLLPQPGGHASLASRGGHEHTVVLIASTFLPVRAHVPFVPPCPPRLIFVGVTDRPENHLPSIANPATGPSTTVATFCTDRTLFSHALGQPGNRDRPPRRAG
jgi:hypothetical protein